MERATMMKRPGTMNGKAARKPKLSEVVSQAVSTKGGPKKRSLRYHVDPAVGGDGEKAEAQESTELLHARVVLPATAPLGGADSEPSLEFLLGGGFAFDLRQPGDPVPLQTSMK
jgi:hypothetical protein